MKRQTREADAQHDDDIYVAGVMHPILQPIQAGKGQMLTIWLGHPTNMVNVFDPSGKRLLRAYGAEYFSPQELISNVEQWLRDDTVDSLRVVRGEAATATPDARVGLFNLAERRRAAQ